jgi:hypothetical protein
MGAGIAPQCSRNRCIARWTVLIPIVAAEPEQVERTRRKTWSPAWSEVFVPYRVRGDRRAPKVALESNVELGLRTGDVSSPRDSLPVRPAPDEFPPPEQSGKTSGDGIA